MKIIFLLVITVGMHWAASEDLAATMQQMQAEINRTTEPDKKARMLKRFQRSFTPKFETQMRNAQNNLSRSLARLGKALAGGKRSVAFTELKTFERHLERFERLSKAANRLPQYSNTKFELRLGRGKPGAPRYVVQATPNLSSVAPKGTPMASNVKQFLSQAGLVERPKNDKTKIRTPSSSGAARGRGAPMKADSIINPGSAAN